MRPIDADAILKASRRGKVLYLDDTRTDGYTDVLLAAEVECAPTIEAEPVRHGEWITDEMAIDSGFTSCSCCRSEYYIEDLQALEGDNDFVMYCPNCGAKMDGGDSS